MLGYHYIQLCTIRPCIKRFDLVASLLENFTQCCLVVQHFLSSFVSSSLLYGFDGGTSKVVNLA